MKAKGSELSREIRLWIVSILIGWIYRVLPKDQSCGEWFLWLSKIPIK